jgi:hypothetical protein
MRSFRSKPVGWRYESHKHALAAKGIRSKYFADSAPDKYDKVADFLHAAADDGRAKVPDFHEQHRQDMVNGVVKQYSDEFSQGESAGVFRAGATKSFLQDDLTNECKDFIDEKIDEQTFKSNLARRAAKHKQQHSATLDVWGAMEGKGPENDHNAGAFMPEILQDAKPAAYLAKKDSDPVSKSLDAQLMFEKKRDLDKQNKEYFDEVAEVGTNSNEIREISKDMEDDYVEAGMAREDARKRVKAVLKRSKAFEPAVMTSDDPDELLFAKKFSAQNEYNGEIRQIKLWDGDRPDLVAKAAINANILEKEYPEIKKSPLVQEKLKERRNTFRTLHPTYLAKKDTDRVIVVARDKRHGVMVKSDVIPRNMVAYFKYTHFNDLTDFEVRDAE